MQDDIKLTFIKTDAKELIQCRLESCRLPSFPTETCLIASFGGSVEETVSKSEKLQSAGSNKSNLPIGGYGYMHAMIGDGFAACNPATLILDLHDLKYESGEQMNRIIDQRIITKVVASELNRNGLARIYSSILFLSPEAEMFRSVESALNACDSSYRQFLRDGRKKIIAADF